LGVSTRRSALDRTRRASAANASAALRGRAVLEGGADRRARELLAQVGLRLGEATDEDREAARGAQRADLLAGEAQTLQASLHEVGQRLDGSLDEGRGELLAADLEEQVAFGHVCPLGALSRGV
jgi:hypothetical protein